MAYEFYWISGSPNAWRAMLALEYKGIAYVSHRLDPSKKEHKTPEFIALNPRGKVPVLKNGDVVIHESVAIMAYLEREHPEVPIFGSTSAETGRVWQRIQEVVNYVRDPIDDGVVRPLIRGEAAQVGDRIKAAAEIVHSALAWMEAILADSSYLAGEFVSAADFNVMPNVQMLARVGRRDDALALGLEFQNLRATYPAISGWLGRLEKLVAYDRSYPPHWRTS